MRLWTPAEINRDWWRLGDTLAPAIAIDGKRTVGGVLDALLMGDFALFTINEDSVNLTAVIELHQIDEAKCLSLIYLAGRIGLPPRSWINRMQTLASRYLVETAKAMGCGEIRIEGRDWSSVFPDWDRLDGTHELRKRL
jgi:hypothetical protein